MPFLMGPSLWALPYARTRLAPLLPRPRPPSTPASFRASFDASFHRSCARWVRARAPRFASIECCLCGKIGAGRRIGDQPGCVAPVSARAGQQLANALSKASGVAECPARPILLSEAVVGGLGQAADRLGPRGCLVLLPTRDLMRFALESQRDLALVVVDVGEQLELAVRIHRGREVGDVHGDVA